MVLIAGLLANSQVAAIIGTRIGTRLPASPTYPLIVASLVSDIPGQPWESRVRVQLDCWAASEEGASALSRTVVAVHPSLRGTYSAGRLLNTSVLNRLWSPDPVNNQPRFLVDLGLVVA